MKSPPIGIWEYWVGPTLLQRFGKGNAVTKRTGIIQC